MADHGPGTSGSAPIGEDDGEVAISLNEYIEAESQLEDDARAVLGGSDMQNCTYNQGYVQRQALYACSTCSDDKEEAGICLACGLNCHDGHDLYELYTKRNFRCDCGNKQFETKCKLQPNKDEKNPNNKYNQNFRGVYCVCSRPYPDPQNETDGEMIQCCVCEDWYHDNHLDLGNNTVPEEYEEMVCINCVKLNQFLLKYPNSNLTAETVSSTDEKTDVDVTSSTDATSSETIPIKQEPASAVKQAVSESDDTSLTADSKSEVISAKQEPADSDIINKLDLKPDVKLCSYLRMQTGTAHRPRTLFMLSGWRQRLCTCSQCTQLYRQSGVEFLTDDTDPTHVYETKSKNADGQSTSYEKGMSALSELDRVQQIELISGYNDMKSSLAEYLKKFASNNKVVRAEDIQEFFEDFKKNKKQKVAVPPSSCS